MGAALTLPLNVMRHCVHAESTDWPSIVCCALGLFGGRPSMGQCERCSKRSEPVAEMVGAERRAEVVEQGRGTNGNGWHGELLAEATIAPAELVADAVTRDRAYASTSDLVEEIASERAQCCHGCEHNSGITGDPERKSTFRVKCRRCGCDGLSLLDGACPAGKWPAKRADPGGHGPGRANGTPRIARGRKLLLRSALSPGDVVTMTAAIRDLHRAHPGQFVTDVDTTANELWENNPNVIGLSRDDPEVQEIWMHYPLINESNQRPLHFIHGYADYLAGELGVPIPLTEFRGDIHVNDEERSWTNQVEEGFGYRGRFWILVAGGKFDFTAKWWSPAFFQQVVDHFAGRVQFVQCGEAGHWHPALKNAFSLIGKTSIRQLIRLIVRIARPLAGRFAGCGEWACAFTFGRREGRRRLWSGAGRCCRRLGWRRAPGG